MEFKTLGAIGGKHIHTKSVHGCGSLYINYKRNHSIILMVLVDSNYTFIYVDVGCNGRIREGEVFINTYFYRILKTPNNPLTILYDRRIPGRHKSIGESGVL